MIPVPLPRLDLTGRVGDQVFSAMHHAIISGELRAGTRLRIRDLAAELGTSVMPVREAIRRLEEMGLVESEPYRGAIVKGFTERELLDLYGARRLLEIEATVQGAARVSAGGQDVMRTVYDEMAAAIDARDALGYLARDEDFLAIVYDASGNAILPELIRGLWHRCRTYKILGAQEALDSGDTASLLTYQQQLLQAVADEDPARAGEITAASLDAAIQRIGTSMDRA